MSDHIASRLAIHESCHAAADFLLNRPIHSVQIGQNDGIVRVGPTEDPFAAIVALLAPHTLEDALGFERSGDDSDERAVEDILHRYVLPADIPEARAALHAAADELVVSLKFDTLRRALSKHLKSDTYLTGDEVEEILLEALEGIS